MSSQGIPRLYAKQPLTAILRERASPYAFRRVVMCCRSSGQRNPTVQGPLAPQLFARHFGDKSLELHGRQLFTNAFQPERDVFTNGVLSIFGVDVAPTRDSLPARSSPFLWNCHFACCSCGGVVSMRAEAEWWEPVCGYADSPDRRLTASTCKARMQPYAKECRTCPQP